MRYAMFVVGVVLILLGLLFTGQGLGYIQGSGMTGSTFWALAGPVIAIVGAVVVWRAGRSTRRPV